MDESRLSLLCVKGDADAQRILYENYSEHLYGVCLRYMGSREEALDLLHDTFIKIYHIIERYKYRGTGSLKAWLTRVTINEAIELLRRQKQWQEIEAYDIVGYDEPLEDEVERIPHTILLKFIEELPPKSRAIFNLYVFEDYSHKEIAEKLGIKEKSSSSQLHRAKESIIEKINKYKKENNYGKQ